MAAAGFDHHPADDEFHLHHYFRAVAVANVDLYRGDAAREVQQETGLAISPTQLEPVPLTARQLAATILCHRAHLYRAVLADEQLKGLRAAEKAGRSFGANPGERCYVTIKTVAEVMQSGCVDWGQVGMILSALSSELQQRRG